MFVDPRPAEGVYAALGMGWAGSAPSSPALGEREFKYGENELARDVLRREQEIDGEDAAETTEKQVEAAPLTSEGTAQGQDADPHAAPASYIAHGVLAGVGAVVLRALRAGMPVWERGGDIRLLGGEFVFEVESGPSPSHAQPRLRCTYAHRMQTTRGHADVRRVFAAAGVHVPIEDVAGKEKGKRARAKSVDVPRSSPTTATTAANGGIPRSSTTAIASIPRASVTIPRSSTTTAIPRVSASASLTVPPMVASATSTAPTPAATTAPTTATAIPPHVTAVPRSASTPTTRAGAREGNIFMRFAGPRGGRAPVVKEKEKERGRTGNDANGLENGENTQRAGIESTKGPEKTVVGRTGILERTGLFESMSMSMSTQRPAIPRSASTPPGKVGGGLAGI
ncbi:hypothetical protein C8R43DRAFT_1012857, partial [Mycena crocata]